MFKQDLRIQIQYSRKKYENLILDLYLHNEVFAPVYLKLIITLTRIVCVYPYFCDKIKICELPEVSAAQL